MSRVNVFWRVIEFENRIRNKAYQRKLHMSDMFIGFEYEGILYTSGVNTTLDIYSEDPSCGKGRFTYDPRCRFWYISTKNETSIKIFQPSNIYSHYPPIVATSACQRLLSQNNRKLHSIFCLDIELSTTQKYFQSYSNTAEQYFIDPSSFYILYNSNQNQNNHTSQNFFEVELKNLKSENEATNFNLTLNNYFDSLENEHLQSINLDMSFSQRQFAYDRNGTQTRVILDPILIYDQIPNYEDDSLNKKFQIKMAYLQINLISDELLKENSNKIEQYFNKFFLFVGIILGIIGIISIIIINIYALRIKNMINASITHLKNVIQQMNEQDISKDIFNLDTKNFFLSKETRQLFDSFKEIYQLLLQTSESFFEDNETTTLLKLYKNIEFFKQFGNTQALGITLNNIGSILLSKGHYFQALEIFSSSIVYAKYQIQEFLDKYPQSFNSSILNNFAFNYKPEVENFQDKVKSINNMLFLIIIILLIFYLKKDNNLTCEAKVKSTNIITSIAKQSEDQSTQFKGFNHEGKMKKLFKQILFGRSKQNSIDKRGKGLLNKLSNDSFYEDRIELLSNLYFRKRNYIITLIAFQENNDENKSICEYSHCYFNFWREIKFLLKELIVILHLLPFDECYQLEIQSMISKCQFYLNDKFKSNQILNYCENQIGQRSSIKKETQEKENIIFNKNNRIKQNSGDSTILTNQKYGEDIDDLIVPNNFKKFKSRTKEEEDSLILSSQNQINNLSFKYLNNTDQFLKHKMAQIISQDVNHDLQSISLNQSHFENQQNLSQQKLLQVNFQQNQVLLENSNNSLLSNRNQVQKSTLINNKWDAQKLNCIKGEDANDQFELISYNEEKRENERQKDIKLQSSALQINNNHEQYPKKQKSKINFNNIMSLNENSIHKSLNCMINNQSPEKKDIEQFLESRRKKQTLYELNNQLFNYFSCNNLDTIVNLVRAELLIQDQSYQNAAEILTSLLENQQVLVCHYPYKIFKLLKTIFDRQNIQSSQLNQIYSKFNPNISMKVGVICSCQGQNSQIINSISLLSNLVSKVLTHSSDQIGVVVVVDESDQFISNLLPLSLVIQIKKFMSQILNNILFLISKHSLNTLNDQDYRFDQLNKSQDQISLLNDNKNIFSFNQDIDKKGFTMRKSQLSLKASVQSMKKIKFKELPKSLPHINNQLNNFKEQQENLQIINQSEKKIHNTSSIFKNRDQTLSSNFFKQDNQYKLQQNKGDLDGTQQDQDYLTSLSLGDEQNHKSLTYNNYLFHNCIRKAISQIFEDNILYSNILLQISKNYQQERPKYFKSRQESQFSHQSQFQQKYIIYSTQEIFIINNYLFFKLSQLLSWLKIQLLILSDKRTNNFLEKLPGQTFIFNNNEIIRVFYSNTTILSYLKCMRDKFSRNVYPSIIQHY